MDRKRARFNPEKYCPICGISWDDKTAMENGRHKCPVNVLAGKNTVQTSSDRDDFHTEGLHEQSYGDQLSKGFAMLDEDYYADED